MRMLYNMIFITNDFVVRLMILEADKSRWTDCTFTYLLRGPDTTNDINQDKFLNRWIKEPWGLT